MKYRNYRQCILDLSETQLEDDELGEYKDYLVGEMEREQQRLKRERRMRECSGWAGGMVISKPR